MLNEPWIFFLALFLSFFFAFWNGFTDAANAISTIVATRVLSPVRAVLLSAIGNFTGLFLGTAVAQTIGKGIVESGVINDKFIVAVLAGGLLWDVSTWFFALPISESHVLVGALIGAGLVAGGLGAVKFASVFDKVLMPMVTSPFIAFIVAFLLIGIIIRIFSRWPVSKTNRYFRVLQIVSSFFFSVSHGTNDAQKAMGIITVLLYSQGVIKEFSVPLWVMLTSYLLLSLGTLFGGWRIVKTMATKITKLRPYQGFCAEAGASIVLLGAALVGFPVSTTHAISGAIMGVGATRRMTAVRWVTARKIVWAWILTMPVSALFAGTVYFLISKLV